MQIREYAAADTDMVRQVVRVANAQMRVDSPWDHEETALGWSHWLKNGWDGDAPRAFVCVDDGSVAAHGELLMSSYDNLALVEISIGVDPARRRHGLGTSMLRRLIAESVAIGKASALMSGWDNAATRAFAAHHGFAPKLVEVCRRQTVADLDWTEFERLRSEAVACAREYRILRVAGRTPTTLLPALAELVGAINDAPNDELDIEDEVFPPERIERYEARTIATNRLYRVIAQHRSTGALAGHTVVAIEKDRPHIGEQDDTSVVAAHRGHRLGILLKAEMNVWLREVEPQLGTIDTWNAKSNKHMIAVNEALGYRPLGEIVNFQAPIADLPQNSR